MAGNLGAAADAAAAAASHWQGRAAAITGAASGIGRAFAERVLAAGGRVLAADMDAAALAWTREHPHAFALVGDVTEEQTNAELARQARERFGALHALVLNAGLPQRGPIEDLPLADFDRALAVNLRAVVLGLRAALPLLCESEAPAVVVTASVSGLGGDPGLWPYNAAKAGAINLVRAAALDLAPRGIRVNAVCPGPIHTAMTRGVRETPQLYQSLRANIPLRRWGEPGEVAAAMDFLASPAASFITGAILPVDGGLTANTGQFSLTAPE